MLQLLLQLLLLLLLVRSLQRRTVPGHGELRPGEPPEVPDEVHPSAAHPEPEVVVRGERRRRRVPATHPQHHPVRRRRSQLQREVGVVPEGVVPAEKAGGEVTTTGEARGGEGRICKIFCFCFYDPTNIASVNLVISCNKVFISLIQR